MRAHARVRLRFHQFKISKFSVYSLTLKQKTEKLIENNTKHTPMESMREYRGCVNTNSAHLVIVQCMWWQNPSIECDPMNLNQYKWNKPNEFSINRPRRVHNFHQNLNAEQTNKRRNISNEEIESEFKTCCAILMDISMDLFPTWNNRSLSMCQISWFQMGMPLRD